MRMSMAHAKRVAPALGAGLALALTLAACGGGDNNSSSSSSAASGAKGGTATVYHETDVEHLDPARNYVTDSYQIGKLITRTLTVFKWNADSKKAELKPDLAASWEASDDLKTWTFKLKDTKYEDGNPVTAKDLK